MTEPLVTYAHWAALYDIAFSWDVTDEVAWLLTRLGADTRQVLEPACGSARLWPAFMARGVSMVGVEVAAAMIRQARRRMEENGLPAPEIHVSDMARFDLGVQFDGAVCPINSFGYLLTNEDAAAHLATVARHLRPGRRYLLQVDLLNTDVSVEYGRDDSQAWEAESDGERLRCTWRALSFDATTCLQVEEAQFEPLDGVHRGKVFKEKHTQRKWSWPAWAALIAASPFELAAVYDTDPQRTALPLDERVEEAGNTWHELVLPE